VSHHIGDECPGGHVFDLVDVLETTVEKWIEAIKQERLPSSAWTCVDDLRQVIGRYAARPEREAT
jgi:hypothetical protein